jgi:hypothetical protein
MNYKECPHYDEMLRVLSEGSDFEDISFEIDEIHNCKGCSENGVCELWVTLIFVEDMKPQMNISDAKVTIENLNEQMSKIVRQLVSNSKSKQ